MESEVDLKTCCKDFEKRHPEGMADYFLIKQAYSPALMLGQSEKA